MYGMQKTNTGKITVLAILWGVAALALVFFLDIEHGGNIQKATADSATTSVTVLNTPPIWDVNPAESPASATTTPTNVGDSATWIATASDGNGEDYYLLICKNSSAPTPNPSAAPDCNGGAANQWAVSASTVSGNQATASYVAQNADAETEDWYAFICDAN